MAGALGMVPSITVCFGLEGISDHLIPISWPWAGTFSTGPGLSKLHPAWPWIIPGMEYLSTHSLGNLCQGLTILTGNNFCFLISNLILPSVSLKLFPLVLFFHALLQSLSPAPFRCWKVFFPFSLTVISSQVINSSITFYFQFHMMCCRSVL